MEKLRRDYKHSELELDILDSDPIRQFINWFEEARQLAPDWFEVNAMTLATSTPDGQVSARIVLLKKADSSGFSFFTNYGSQKAQQINENPCASLVFYWPHVERQVRVEGTVLRTDSATSDLYFQARPRASQIGATISPQSQVIENRERIEADATVLEQRYHPDKPIPRPDYWGGLQLSPMRIEFWQGRPNRLHDRFVYTRIEGAWKIDRLAP